MLQRLQTIFLAIIAIAMGIFLSNPIWVKISAINQQKITLFALQLEHNGKAIETPYYLGILAIFSILIALFSISQYKKRILQLTLGVVNSILLATILGLIFYLVFKVGTPIFEPEKQGNYTIGFYAVAIALFSNMVANRLIRKDELVVKDSNRMR